MEFENFCLKNFFVEYKRQVNINKDIINSNRTLLNEVKSLRENLKGLNEKQQNDIYKNINSDNTHLLYINLKEKYELLLKEHESIKNEKEMLVKHYEEKILVHKEELEIEKKNVEAKENEIYEKLQWYQSSTALQTDQLEMKWQSRLDSVNQQLKDSNMCCNTLRNQLLDIKNRSLFANGELERRIQELEQSLVIAEERLRRTEDKLSKQSTIPTYGVSKSRLYTKSKPSSYKLDKFDPPEHPLSMNTSIDTFIKNYEPLPVNITKELNKTTTSMEMQKSPKRQTKRKLYTAEEYEYK